MKFNFLSKSVQNYLINKASTLAEALPYIRQHTGKNIVIKYGGHAMGDTALAKKFSQDIGLIKEVGINPIIVHGGGPRIKKKLNELNIESIFIKGLRVTNDKVIKVVEKVLIEFNKEIVDELNKKNCKAESITTKENNIIFVKPEKKELGFVGIPNKIDDNLLNKIIKSEVIPVLTPMGLDNNGQAHNINADTAAGAVAKKIKSRRLLLMTDVEGVYDKEKKLISEITPDQATKMIREEVIIGGMIPKINTCIDVARNGVKGVVIIDGRRPHSILFELFSDQGAGTLIREWKIKSKSNIGFLI